MPAIKPPKFGRPELLRKLKPASRSTLLNPFRDYFCERGCPLPAIFDDAADYEAISLVLMSPDEHSPSALIETLEMLELLADPQCIFDFEQSAYDVVARLREPDDSAGDLAIKLLREAPDVAWQVFDRRALAMPRSLTSYISSKPMREPTPARLAALERLMAPWFESNGRSEVCRVRAHRHAEGWSFVIRHGDPITRIGIIGESGQSASALFRPERLDIAFYSATTREWRVSGIGGKLQRLYQQAFGRELHGDAAAVTRSSRYTLEPLRGGRDALAANNVPAIQVASLKQLTFRLGACPITLGPGDVFAAIEGMGVTLTDITELHEATFALKLSHRRALVHVRVRPGQDNISAAAGLPVVDEWLEKTGFASAHHDTDLLAHR
jgi:hypothetical protein